MEMSPYFFEIWINQYKDVIILPIDKVCQGNYVNGNLELEDTAFS
jgi:hypothetical protein